MVRVKVDLVVLALEAKEKARVKVVLEEVMDFLIQSLKWQL